MSNIVKRGIQSLDLSYDQQESGIVLARSSFFSAIDSFDKVFASQGMALLRKEIRNELEEKYGIDIDVRNNGLRYEIVSSDKIIQGDILFYKRANSLYFFQVHGRKLRGYAQRSRELEAIAEVFDLTISQGIQPRNPCFRRQPDYSANDNPEINPFFIDFEYNIQLVDDNELLIATIFDCRKKPFEEVSIYKDYPERSELLQSLVEQFYHAKWR